MKELNLDGQLTVLMGKLVDQHSIQHAQEMLASHLLGLYQPTNDGVETITTLLGSVEVKRLSRKKRSN